MKVDKRNCERRKTLQTRIGIEQQYFKGTQNDIPILNDQFPRGNGGKDIEGPIPKLDNFHKGNIHK